MGKQRDKIFVIGTDGFEEVVREPYESEDLLQKLLEEYPEVMAGDLLDPNETPRFLFVGREVGVPDAEDAANRWALDHLFIDQNAIPTLVEVKRSSDTRIRREVVGQMLDYAANAQLYWPLDRVRRLAEECLGDAEKLTEAVLDLLGLEQDDTSDVAVEEFWEQVGNNLRLGQVRLVFVADAIPSELRRIIEFLNEQMQRVHVVGLELAQYKGKGDLQILVPRAVGQTESARAAKSRTSRSGSLTSEAAFVEECPPAARGFFEQLLREAKARNLEVYWGERGFSVRLKAADHDRKATLLLGYPPGTGRGDEPNVQVDIRERTYNEDERRELREAVLACGGFTESGKSRLRLDLDNNNIASAYRALKVAWAWEERLRLPAAGQEA
jgi:hypothetical protein